MFKFYQDKAKNIEDIIRFRGTMTTKLEHELLGLYKEVLFKLEETDRQWRKLKKQN